MFTIADRDRARDDLIGLARDDDRVIAGAEVGSLTLSGDRWSDLDLTFGLRDGVRVEEVLADWTDVLARDHDAVHLFDLQSMFTTYRVFLFPGNLQVDLSVTPAAVAQMGPKFALLFGSSVRKIVSTPLNEREVFGLAVHHALRARFGVERGRLWSAQYYIAELRDETLSLACLSRGLPAKYARGFDELPADLLTMAASSLVTSVRRDELLRALRSGIHLLRQEGRAVDTFARVEPQLVELSADEI